jgi:hypothetical protein
MNIEPKSNFLAQKVTGASSAQLWFENCSVRCKLRSTPSHITVEWQIAQKNWSNICSVEHKMMMLKEETSPLFSRSDTRLVGCPFATRWQRKARGRAKSIFIQRTRATSAQFHSQSRERERCPIKIKIVRVYISNCANAFYLSLEICWRG